MSSQTPIISGTVVSLFRYPVKSMMGEELNAVELADRGLVGDRGLALVDVATGKIVSAKNPKKWPGLFDFRAAFVEPPRAGGELPPVRITLPDGTTLTSQEGTVAEALSEALGREVRLESTPPDAPSLEEYWPDVEDLDHRDTVTDEAILKGSFFDGAAVHLLSTATIDRLRAAYPGGRFEARRFRPNVVVEPSEGAEGFVENDWVDHTLAIGDEARIKVTGLCPRCVMTTLPQGDLPKDPGILRAAVKENKAHVGAYASVVRGGTIRRGDAIRPAE
ncbi:MAG: MOSC domain-containing protein [Planctomycetota bacterium]|jgi:uncharacterized protein YcbX